MDITIPAIVVDVASCTVLVGGAVYFVFLCWITGSDVYSVAREGASGFIGLAIGILTTLAVWNLTL